MKILQEVEILSRGYVRKGGKDNRRQQRARMLAFAAFCAGEGAHSLAQVGAAHVIRYWRATQHLSDATRYNHWRAFCVLWTLCSKSTEPPKPHGSKCELNAW